MEFERKLFNWFVIPGIITEILVIALGLNLNLLSNPIGGPAGMVAGIVMLKFELMFLLYLFIAGIYCILLPYKYYKKTDTFMMTTRKFMKFSVIYLVIFDALILYQWYDCARWNLIRSLNTPVLIPLTIFVFFVTGYFIFWLTKVNRYQEVKFFNKSTVGVVLGILGLLLIVLMLYFLPMFL